MSLRWGLIAGACIALAVSSRIAADTVICADGRTLEGEVEVQGDTVVIKGRFGRTSIPRAEVLEIRKGGGDAEEYARKLEQIEKSDKAKDAEAHFELGKWAKERRLLKEAEARFRRVIEIDPDHAGARAELGYVKYMGQWMLEEDAMKAKGMVKVGGKWMTPAEAEKLLNSKAEDSKRTDQPREPQKVAPEVGEMMVLVKCPVCGGTGFIASQADCRRCKGTGFMYNDGVQVICNACHGTGKAGSQCLNCRGTGKVWQKK